MKNTRKLPEDVVEGEDVVFADDATAKFDPTDRIYNGQRAEALLSDPLFNAAIAAVAERYRLTWENSVRGDLAAQQAAHYSLAALKDVVSMIRKYVGNAKLREADLKFAEKRSQIRNY